MSETNLAGLFAGYGGESDEDDNGDHLPPLEEENNAGASPKLQRVNRETSSDEDENGVRRFSGSDGRAPRRSSELYELEEEDSDEVEKVVVSQAPAFDREESEDEENLNIPDIRVARDLAARDAENDAYLELLGQDEGNECQKDGNGVVDEKEDGEMEVDDMVAVEEEEKDEDDDMPSTYATTMENELPPSPPGNCDQRLEDIFESHFEKKSRGVDIIKNITKNKQFKNPAVYEYLVTTYGIDEKGSNFDPSIYQRDFSKADGYLALRDVQERLLNQREAAAKK